MGDAMATLDEIARLKAPERGRFGPYGGQYVAETLMPAIAELEAAWRTARDDDAFWIEIDARLHDYVGRPTRLYHARREFFALAAKYQKRLESAERLPTAIRSERRDKGISK